MGFHALECFSPTRYSLFAIRHSPGDRLSVVVPAKCVSVRRWDQQLRQAIFLASPYAVVASAPIEGFLHRTNNLDSLGDDEPETPCRLNR